MVDPFRQHQRRTALADGVEDILDNQSITRFVTG
jgi:hypothetical protein